MLFQKCLKVSQSQHTSHCAGARDFFRCGLRTCYRVKKSPSVALRAWRGPYRGCDTLSPAALVVVRAVMRGTEWREERGEEGSGKSEERRGGAREAE